MTTDVCVVEAVCATEEVRVIFVVVVVDAVEAVDADE